MPSEKTRLNGKGWFVSDDNIIYVQGTIPGYPFRRKSTKMEATPRNIKYVTLHHRSLLEDLVKGKTQTAESFEHFGREVIAQGAKTKGIKGGRGVHSQAEAVAKYEQKILPYFREYRIEDIRVSHIEAWQRRLLTKYSTSTVNKCRVLLGQIMRKAVANDIIQKNPVDFAVKLEIVYKKRIGYTIKEAVRMMTQSAGLLQIYLYLAFTTGLRSGEILGLRWEDIYWEYGVLVLNRSVTKGILTIGSSGKKNHDRVIPLFPEVVETLKAWKAQSNSPWIIANKQGGHYHETKSLIKWSFKPLLKELGIEYRGLYVTRHTWSSIMKNLGVDDDLTSTVAGNSMRVREAHYNTFSLTKERAEAARAQMRPVNSVFFGKEEAAN